MGDGSGLERKSSCAGFPGKYGSDGEAAARPIRRVYTSWNGVWKMSAASRKKARFSGKYVS